MMAVHKGVGHYGAPITLDQAKKVMAAAEAKAIENNWYVAISIMDSGGNPVMLHRLDGTQLASIRIAKGKALTAVEFRRPTKALEDVIARGGAGLRDFTVPNVNFMEGGIPIMVAGKIVGGIGVAGVDSKDDGGREVLAAVMAGKGKAWPPSGQEDEHIYRFHCG